MRCSSASAVCCIIYGERWTSRVSYSTFWWTIDETAAAAKRFFKRLLHGLRYKPRRLVTDGLRSYSVAQRAILPDARHRTSRDLNNRAENSHQPTRRSERQMQRFKWSD